METVTTINSDTPPPLLACKCEVGVVLSFFAPRPGTAAMSQLWPTTGEKRTAQGTDMASYNGTPKRAQVTLLSLSLGP